VVNQNEISTKNLNAVNWFVDNGSTKIDFVLKIFRILYLVMRGLVPRTILIPLSSGDRSGLLSHTPPTPLRHDIGMPTRASLPSAHTNPAFSFDQSRHENRKHGLVRANTEPQTCLINSSNDFETERIYLNQINESHQYASIDLEDSILSESNEDERVKILK
jgi:hypothetical protein